MGKYWLGKNDLKVAEEEVAGEGMSQNCAKVILTDKKNEGGNKKAHFYFFRLQFCIGFAIKS